MVFSAAGLTAGVNPPTTFRSDGRMTRRGRKQYPRKPNLTFGYALRRFEGLVCRICRRHPVSSCFDSYDRLTRPLRSSPIAEPSPLVPVSPSQSLVSVVSPRGFAPLVLLPWHPGSTQKPVPDSRPLYAGRRPSSLQAPDGLIPVVWTAPGFDDTYGYRLVLEGLLSLAFRHSPAPSRARDFPSDAHHHGSLPQQLGPV
jgi:hypothetical protein